MHETIPVADIASMDLTKFYYLEEHILHNIAKIESWFREQWQQTPAPFTASVDLRNSGFKIAPVDTNLFPAGFNNLSSDSIPLCVQATQAYIAEFHPSCKNILLIPENHTRNLFYLQSLAVLRDILLKAGYVVRIGSIDLELSQAFDVELNQEQNLKIEPVLRIGDRLVLADFEPCMLILNNDLSSGMPEILCGLTQKLIPAPELGWFRRLKSIHFAHFSDISQEFAEMLSFDQWFINPYFVALDNIDFMTQTGMEHLAEQTDLVLAQIREKYAYYGIKEEPFVAVKADNGTYGMNVMMIHEGRELLSLNRKARTKMATSKGGARVNKILIQEGVYSFETTDDDFVAEPVLYVLGSFEVGGFYRVHRNRAKNENLNAPGMHFEPLAFACACNIPDESPQDLACQNRFYVYGVIARLAVLAAAREIAALIRR